ncbi:MAG: hypothetical protein LC749_01255 [Actinobacteria bacterium]|nr:hypothetical protein [Actinomycetota bacterium]
MFDRSVPLALPFDRCSGCRPSPDAALDRGAGPVRLGGRDPSRRSGPQCRLRARCSDFLRRHRMDGRVTSALARVEVVRAVPGGGPAGYRPRQEATGPSRPSQPRTRPARDAATVSHGSLLRCLDSIELASARMIGAGLQAVITYDQRMEDVALTLGLAVEAPA